MDLTQASRIKSALEITGTGQDALIGQYITSVSRRVEHYLGGSVQLTGRTEYYDADYGQTSLRLKAIPVSAITSIHDDCYWKWGTNALIGTGNYRVDSNAGVVHFAYRLYGGPQSVKVVYTGGLASTAADLITNGYEDLVLAVDQQVIFEYKKRDNEDLIGYTDAAGSVSVAQPINWLPQVKQTLDLYRHW